MSLTGSSLPVGGGFQRARVDGYRLDAVKHIEAPFWARWNAAIKQNAAPGFLLLGEQLDGDAQGVTAVWRHGGFDSMFDFPLAFALRDVFCAGQSPSRLAVALSADRGYPDPRRLVTLLDNHDLPRVMSVCGGDSTKVADAFAVLASLRGIPSLIWGTEVGQEGAAEPANRASMRFVEHPLRQVVTFWLTQRRANPALEQGVPVVLFADDVSVVIGLLHQDQVAVLRVGGATAALGAPWADARTSLQPNLGQRVVVHVGPIQRGAYASAAAEAETQWRTGAKTVPIRFEGPAGVSVVGSASEIGGWKADRALVLPTTVQLPVGVSIEFKGLKSGRWADGANQRLMVRNSARVIVRGP